GARVETVGQGTGLGVVQSPALRPLGRVGMDAGHWWGPVRADTQMRGQVSQPLGAEGARLQGRIRGRSALGVWGDVGNMRHLAEVGVAADVGGAHGAAAGLPDERAPRPWGFGPVLRSTWLTPRAVPVSFRAAVPWTRNGAMPDAAAATRRGAWTARAQGGRRLQAGALAWDDGIGLLGGGLVHRGSLLWADGRAAWSLPGPLRGVRPGYAGRLDVRAGTLLSHGPRLGWTSSCDCLRVDAGAVWSADREVPDIRLQVGIR
ncbi:MAG: hypothetical protein VX000_06870, partial [Myxococcota bacterium]|nr:hypothetical protein [Myxococcota bacterium]